MPDERTLMQKLRDMAAQTESPNEAEIAREVIKRMLGMEDDAYTDTHRPGSPRVLSREAILATADRDQIGGSIRMQTKDGTWYTIDLDEMNINVEPVVKGR